jgi:hypothetical protein
VQADCWASAAEGSKPSIANANAAKRRRKKDVIGADLWAKTRKFVSHKYSIYFE